MLGEVSLKALRGACDRGSDLEDHGSSHDLDMWYFSFSKDRVGLDINGGRFTLKNLTTAHFEDAGPSSKYPGEAGTKERDMVTFFSLHPGRLTAGT